MWQVLSSLVELVKVVSVEWWGKERLEGVDKSIQREGVETARRASPSGALCAPICIPEFSPLRALKADRGPAMSPKPQWSPAAHWEELDACI